jgi:hypothetical protein
VWGNDREAYFRWLSREYDSSLNIGDILNKNVVDYLKYLIVMSSVYILSWITLVVLVDWMHIWVGYASLLMSIIGINLNFILLKKLWSSGSYRGYIKAVLFAYVLSWVLLVIVVDWMHVWVGYASLIITAVVFNVKFLLLKIFWKSGKI